MVPRPGRAKARRRFRLIAVTKGSEIKGGMIPEGIAGVPARDDVEDFMAVSLTALRSGPRMRLIAVGLALLGGLSGALAQGLECSRLQAQIASMGPGDASAAAGFADAARRQQYELERTQSYAQSIGCNNKQFLFFGSSPPAQCGDLRSQMQRMRENLVTMQAQERRAADGGRSELVARFNASCRVEQPAQAPTQARGNLVDRLFGTEPKPEITSDPMDPGAVDDPSRGGSKLVCVRSCDGGFFPLATSARRSGPEGIADMCRALCPNVETKPYTYFSSADIDQAVSLDGTPYKALPNALKFRTKFDPACTCKPADRSWVQALAEAEALLGRSRSDIVVTPEKAEELSRATTGAPKAPPAKAAPAKTPPGKPGAPAKPEADPTLAIEAAANAKAPTASNDSAGIAANTGGTAKTYGLKDGEMRDQGTAAGTRKVRVVGPTL